MYCHQLFSVFSHAGCKSARMQCEIMRLEWIYEKCVRNLQQRLYVCGKLFQNLHRRPFFQASLIKHRTVFGGNCCILGEGAVCTLPDFSICCERL